MWHYVWKACSLLILFCSIPHFDDILFLHCSIVFVILSVLIDGHWVMLMMRCGHSLEEFHIVHLLCWWHLLFIYSVVLYSCYLPLWLLLLYSECRWCRYLNENTTLFCDILYSLMTRTESSRSIRSVCIQWLKMKYDGVKYIHNDMTKWSSDHDDYLKWRRDIGYSHV